MLTFCRKAAVDERNERQRMKYDERRREHSLAQWTTAGVANAAPSGTQYAKRAGPRNAIMNLHNKLHTWVAEWEEMGVFFYR